MACNHSSVQVSHCPIPYSVGQWDSTPKDKATPGTQSGIFDLKALANRVLASSHAGQSPGQARDYTVKRCPTEDMAVGQSVSPLQALRAELREGASVPPTLPTDPAMAALLGFERNPHGVVTWLAVPENHASRDPAHSARWRACIQHEARLRVEEANQ